MMKLLVNLYFCLTGFAIANLYGSAATPISGSNYELYYDEINEYLVEKVPWTDNLEIDIEASMAAVSDWLIENANSQIGKKWLVRPLLRLKNLLSILNEEKCDNVGYTVLSQNDKAIRHMLHNLETPIRRIDKIIRYFAEKHANICQNIYRNKMVFDRIAMNAGILAQVQAMTFGVISDPADQISVFRVGFFERGEKAIWQDDERNITRILDIITGDNFGPMRAPYKLLAHLARDDPDIKYLKRQIDERLGLLVVNKGKVIELLERYILSPCQEYNELVDHVMTPAAYDDRTLGFGRKKANGKYTQNDLEQVKLSDQYYLNRASFELCRFALERGAELAKLLVKEVSKDGLSYLL